MKIRSCNDQPFTRSPGILIVAESDQEPESPATGESTGTSSCRLPGKLIVAKHRGRRPCDVQLHLGCLSSSITRVVRAFIDDGPDGLLDGRITNGVRKITAAEEEFLLDCAAKSPAELACDRPTWTLEVFALVLKKAKGM